MESAEYSVDQSDAEERLASGSGRRSADAK